MLSKSNPLKYKANGSKIPKTKGLLHFDPIVKVWVLSDGVEDTPLQVVFLFFIQYTVVCIDKLHDCDVRICFPNNGFHKNTYYVKSRSFTYFSGVEILWKGTVSA